MRFADGIAAVFVFLLIVLFAMATVDQITFMRMHRALERAVQDFRP